MSRCNSTWCCCAKQKRCVLNVLQLPYKSILMLFIILFHCNQSLLQIVLGTLFLSECDKHQTFQPLRYRPLYLCLSVWSHVYHAPHLVNINYIWLLHIGKSIFNSEELLITPWVLESLCILISGSLLSWFMCFPTFSILLQILHSLFVLVFFLLYWSHYLTTVMYSMIENLTLNCCYYTPEYNDDIPVRQLFCTGYLYACNRR